MAVEAQTRAPISDRTGDRPAPGLVGPLRSRLPLLAVLYLAAAGISAFTILRGLDPFDEGLMLQAARRVAAGELPYRDFLWPYGPGQPYLLAGVFKMLGVSLLEWRVLRTITDAGVAVVVFALVRRQAPLRLALLAWLAAACAMAQATSANPFAIPLFASLLAIGTATSAGPGRPRVALAGAITALAAAWRLDFALFAAAGVVASLALEPVPRPERLRRIGLYSAVAAALVVLTYLPFLIAAGPGTLWDALAGNSLSQGGYWRLPFPLVYEGALRVWPPGALVDDAKELLDFYLPLVLVVGLVVAAALAARRWWHLGAAPWRSAGVLVFAAGCCLYLLSRTDEFHATPLLVTLAVLLPLSLARAHRGGNRAMEAVLAAAFALLLVYGAANRLSALIAPGRYEPVRVAVADGVKERPSEARSIRRVVEIVQQRTSPADPIYVAPLRSDLVRVNNPLLYVLTERENASVRDFGLLTSASAQRGIVSELRRVRPRVIVRWTAPTSARPEPNLRGRPSGSHLLDAFLEAEYRPLERAGFYDVLVPRG